MNWSLKACCALAGPDNGDGTGNFGFGDTVTTTTGSGAVAPSTTVGTAPTPAHDESGAVTGTTQTTGTAGGVFIPAG